MCRRRVLFLVWLGVVAVGTARCASETASSPPKAAAVTPTPQPPRPDSDDVEPEPGSDEPGIPHAGHHETLSKLPTWSPADLKHRPPPANPKDIARARKLLDKALVFYRKGEYDKAEDLLKQAMVVYPFLAEANLVLGKIFLIRGSATLDRSLINNARLMFEMARTLDPNLHETDLLLELFQAAPQD